MYKLRVAGGLKKGQSLAIRTGGLVVVRNYYEEPLEDLEQYLAKNLQDEIQKLKRFSDTKIISEPDPRPAGLALEEPRPAGLILEDPRQSSAENLQDEIQKPERSSATRMISEPDPRPADLVLEGFFTGIDKGSRVKRMLGPPDQAANVTVSVSGVIKPTSSSS